jgi:hypothetical protein
MRGDRFPPTARENSVSGVVDTEFNAAPPLAGPFWLGADRRPGRLARPAARPVEYATSRAGRPSRGALGLKPGPRGSDRNSPEFGSPPPRGLSNSRTLRFTAPQVDRTVGIGPKAERELVLLHRRVRRQIDQEQVHGDQPGIVALGIEHGPPLARLTSLGVALETRVLCNERLHPIL